MKDDRHILTRVEDNILHIEFNRPDKKNAITRDMYLKLAEAFANADSDKSVRVIFITGRGGCFTGGNDVKDFFDHAAKKNLPENSEERSAGRNFLYTIRSVKKPVVAAVNGHAIGIGVTMLLHFDLVYSSETAEFQIPFVNLGLCPEGGSSLLLPQMMGHKRAAEILLLGEKFDSKKAYELGLINGIFPEDELMDSALEKAGRIAELPAASIILTKSMMKSNNSEILNKIMDYELECFAERLVSPEAQEAFSAFFEKRKADFSGF
jgi:enoyl-CoA hydratase/carnithine racemase